jgi:hypothetical protein
VAERFLRRFQTNIIDLKINNLDNRLVFHQARKFALESEQQQARFNFMTALSTELSTEEVDK